ncbi:hypothetical protein BV25DRAFT_1836951 [Artomyces pyxidatus]|uniref:Uncharacterized protein n=1 Tax=Artomyces pyxidatus TaxID=48021 RepID=A0ACB8T826_9AGAM|nr:hypothetical protein BV25DRAFT_1836951 [Artomyces pyxidatus]
MPLHPHSECMEDKDNKYNYIYTSQPWNKDAWLFAYPFQPRKPLSRPWKLAGEVVIVEDSHLVELQKHIQQQISEWTKYVTDASELERLQNNYKSISPSYKATKKKRWLDLKLLFVTAWAALPIPSEPYETGSYKSLASITHPAETVKDFEEINSGKKTIT